jgi:DNA-binding transcriptional regulator YdaS (Cro superfamily)
LLYVLAANALARSRSRRSTNALGQPFRTKSGLRAPCADEFTERFHTKEFAALACKTVCGYIANKFADWSVPVTPREALLDAIRVLGSQTAVAQAAGPDVQTGHVFYWLNRAAEVPAKYCPGIERATRAEGEVVFCEQLCPSADWGAVRSEAGPSIPTTAEA